MPKLSPARANVPLLKGLTLLSRGKVRDTYELPNGNRLQVATNGISVKDIILNTLVPEKGAILNALNHFWLKRFEDFGIKTHFVACGPEIFHYGVPECYRDDLELQSQAMVVRSCQMAPVEFVARHLITGGGFKEYKKTGRVCGHVLSPGLQDGDALPFILDTPTTKADEGHDESLPASEVRKHYPEQTYLLLKAFLIAFNYAVTRGIILADTKLEFAEDGTLCDEAITPDSSRFVDFLGWKASRGVEGKRKAPTPLDKELARIWATHAGMDALDPKNPDDVAKAHALMLPDQLINQLTQTYRYIFWRLTGDTSERYRREKMSIRIHDKTKKIVVVCGSESDLPEVKETIGRINSSFARISVHVMSCHPNPAELQNFAKEGCGGADVVVGIGSKALALPGILDSWLRFYGKDIPVIGVAIGQPGSKSLQAAQLSIEELPNPVITNEIEGCCYKSSDQALSRIIWGELPPPKPRVEKPVQMNVFKNF